MAVGVKPAVSRFAQMLRDGTIGAFTGENLGRTVHYSVFGAGSAGDPKNMSPDDMWKAQPNLRTVVDFYARHTSQLKLHTYKRQEDGAERVHDEAISKILRRPNPSTTGTELIYSLVADMALHDEGFLWVKPADPVAQLYVIPAGWVSRNKVHALAGPDSYTVQWGDDSEPTKIPADQMLEFKGWTPNDPSRGTSPVDTLRLILEERHSAQKYRNQVWRSSGRMGGTFTRPENAPKWNDAARRRFMRMVDDFTGNGGSRAGQDMLLEDGIKYERVSLAAKDEQFVEAAKLSLETVAQVYQVNPTMIGLLDNANFASVREFRRGLYGDTLGPVLARLEDRFNEFLLPMLGAPDDIYVEFNVEAKLRGSFEEQAGVVSKSTGGPWQTRNEARKLFNLPPLPGGDELITPKNVSIGGQASPEDGGEDTSDYEGAPGGESEPEDDVQEEAKHVEVIAKFLDHQRQSVNSRIGSGRKDWWDLGRWSRSLTAKLMDAGVPEDEAARLSLKANTAIHQRYLDAGVVPLSMDDLLPVLAAEG